MDNFTRCCAITLAWEGGYSAERADPGNWTSGQVGHGQLKGTNFGISAASYPDVDIAKLSEADAQAIYRRDFWAPLHADQLPLPVAMALFDTAVNAGLHRAVLLLQQALGIPADGDLGPKTLAMAANRNASELARELLVRRIDYSSRLAAWPLFGLGWSRRIIALAGAITA